jgi:nucleotide-binding universal stress UspA family protein
MGVSHRPAGAAVVGFDSSWESQKAVVAATREASLGGTEVVLLAVVERHAHRPVAWLGLVEVESTQAPQAPQAPQAAKAAAGRAMAKIVESDPGLAVRTVIVKDLDSPELAELCSRGVVAGAGAPRRRRLGDLLPGVNQRGALQRIPLSNPGGPRSGPAECEPEVRA